MYASYEYKNPHLCCKQMDLVFSLFCSARSAFSAKTSTNVHDECHLINFIIYYSFLFCHFYFACRYLNSRDTSHGHNVYAFWGFDEILFILLAESGSPFTLTSSILHEPNHINHRPTSIYIYIYNYFFFDAHGISHGIYTQTTPSTTADMQHETIVRYDLLLFFLFTSLEFDDLKMLLTMLGYARSSATSW